MVVLSADDLNRRMRDQSKHTPATMPTTSAQEAQTDFFGARHASFGLVQTGKTTSALWALSVAARHWPGGGTKWPAELRNARQTHSEHDKDEQNATIIKWFVSSPTKPDWQMNKLRILLGPWRAFRPTAHFRIQGIVAASPLNLFSELLLLFVLVFVCVCVCARGRCYLVGGAFLAHLDVRVRVYMCARTKNL